MLRKGLPSKVILPCTGGDKCTSYFFNQLNISALTCDGKAISIRQLYSAREKFTLRCLIKNISIFLLNQVSRVLIESARQGKLSGALFYSVCSNACRTERYKAPKVISKTHRIKRAVSSVTAVVTLPANTSI